MLTRSRVEGWTTGHLKSAALGWERAATIIEEHYGKAQSTVGRVPWTGPASDRANDKLSENMAKVRGTLDLMRDAAGIAKSGAESIDAAKDDAVNAIKDAEAQFFSVSEDLTVTDRVPWIISPRPSPDAETEGSAHTGRHSCQGHGAGKSGSTSRRPTRRHDGEAARIRSRGRQGRTCGHRKGR